MRLFDIFKEHKNEEIVTYNGLTFWAPKPISNEEYQRKRQKEIDYLERKYDLSTVEGIEAIPVPKQKEPSIGGLPNVTGKIEYYLMRKAGEYEGAGKVDLALACYRKANALMSMSSIAYQYETYLRLPRYLRKLRRFDEARTEEAKIERLFSSGEIFLILKKQYYFYHKNAVYRGDYDWLWEFLPEICPKTFSEYMRMKNARTEKYQKIVIEAENHGRPIK